MQCNTVVGLLQWLGFATHGVVYISSVFIVIQQEEQKKIGLLFLKSCELTLLLISSWWTLPPSSFFLEFILHQPKQIPFEILGGLRMFTGCLDRHGTLPGQQLCGLSGEKETDIFLTLLELHNIFPLATSFENGCNVDWEMPSTFCYTCISIQQWFLLLVRVRTFKHVQ